MVAVVGREADVAVLGPGLAAIQASGDRLGLRPRLAVVVSVDEPRLPVPPPSLRVSAEKEQAAIADGHEFRRPLAHRLAFARKADVHGLQRRPRPAFVEAAGQSGVVLWRRLKVIARQHEQRPRAIRQLAQRGVAHELVRCDAVVGDAGEILLRVLGRLRGPFEIGADGCGHVVRCPCCRCRCCRCPDNLHFGAFVENEQHHLLEAQPLAGLHVFAIQAHAIDLAGEELHFGHLDFGEASLLQRFLLARGLRAHRRRHRVKRTGLGDLHVNLLDARAQEGQAAHLLRHLLDHIVAIGEKPRAQVHHRGLLGRRRQRFARLAGLRFEPADVRQLAKHDAVGGASVVALRDGEPDRALVLVEGRVLKGLRRRSLLHARAKIDHQVRIQEHVAGLVRRQSSLLHRADVDGSDAVAIAVLDATEATLVGGQGVGAVTRVAGERAVFEQ